MESGAYPGRNKTQSKTRKQDYNFYFHFDAEGKYGFIIVVFLFFRSS